MIGAATPPYIRRAELVSASIPQTVATERAKKWTLKQVQGDDHGVAISLEGSVG